MLFAEFANRVNVVAFLDESVFRPDSIADHRAQGAFLQRGKGVQCFGFDHLSGASEIDRARGDIEPAGLKFARNALADKSCPSLSDVPADESRASGKEAELDSDVGFPVLRVRDVPPESFR